MTAQRATDPRRPEPGRSSASKSNISLARAEARSGYAFILPALLVVCAVLIYPILFNFNVSLRDWRWFSPPSERGAWIWFENYADTFSSAIFWESLTVTARFVFLVIVLEYLLGLGLALLLNTQFRARGVFRTAFLLPMMLAPLVVGIQWKWMLSGNFGVVQYMLRSIGLNVPNWLSSPTFALYAVIVADAWQHVPFIALILLAALQSISGEIYESAQIDGASYAQRFRYITMPLIIPASLLAILLRGTDAFKMFDLAYVMTGGGPARVTEVLALHTYRLAFSEGEFGRAAAIAVFMMLIAVIAGGLLVRMVRTEAQVL